MAENVNEIPIRWGKFVNHEMKEQKVVFIGAEKAIFDKNGKRLDNKVLEIEDNLSDAFSTAKSYAAGDYCIYLDSMYKFTTAKSAGDWDGTKVVPVIISEEIKTMAADISRINGNLKFYTSLNGKTKIANLPWGIYNLSANEVMSLEDLPTDYMPSRTIIITTGESTFDEKTAFIMPSHNRAGGQFFLGHMYGSGNPFTWQQIVTNNDLASRFTPIRINGEKGDTFSSVLKNTSSNSVNFIAFASGNDFIADNPFTFKNGYGIVFHSGMMSTPDSLMIWAAPLSNDASPEFKIIKLLHQ